jgi:hypothetical protein
VTNETALSTTITAPVECDRENGDARDKDQISSILKMMVSHTAGTEVTLGEVFNALDQRSYGPLLLVPALIAVAPTGAIPGMSIVTGSLISLLAVQLLVGRKHPWIPARLEAFSFSRDALKMAVEKALPWVEWVECRLKKRLEIFVSPLAHHVIGFLCLALALTMLPLALLPFAVALPGTAIMFLALGMTSRDGVLVLVGLLITAFAVGLTLWAL